MPNSKKRSSIQIIRPGYTDFFVTRNTVPSNILMELVNKVLQRPALVCGQVALDDIRCGRPRLGQELAVCCV